MSSANLAIHGTGLHRIAHAARTIARARTYQPHKRTLAMSAQRPVTVQSSHQSSFCCQVPYTNHNGSATYSCCTSTCRVRRHMRTSIWYTSQLGSASCTPVPGGSGSGISYYLTAHYCTLPTVPSPVGWVWVLGQLILFSLADWRGVRTQTSDAMCHTCRPRTRTI